MLFVTLLACATTPEAPARPHTNTIPEAQPPSGSIPEVLSQAAEPVDADPAVAFATAPASIGRLYRLTLAADAATFTADPAAPMLGKAASTRGFQATPTAAGGRSIQLAGGPITSASWSRGTLQDLAPPVEHVRLRNAGYNLATPRDVLSVRAARDAHPTRFVFSEDASALGIVGVCDDVTVMDFKASRPMTVRKPVIYIYPERTMPVTVDVRPKGPFTVRYPKAGPEGWSVTAHPDGSLDHDGRTLPYLFWEAEGAPFTLDPARSHLVARDTVIPFLHGVCDAYALTDHECADYVTYWLPELAAHPYHLVAFVDAPYTTWAPLTVTPTPDTVIRLYMLIQALDAPVKTIAPPLPEHTRAGFTVVEWGGSTVETPRR